MGARRLVCTTYRAGIDIFSFDESGKIVEHWEVLQIVPQKIGERQYDVSEAAR